MRAKTQLCVVLVIVAAVLALLAADSRSSSASRPIEGGTFRIAMNVNPAGIDSVDPARLGSRTTGLILRPTCAQLMAFPGPKPEVSAGYPKVSRDRLTYTFTIRPGFRFNTGEPVTAGSFAHAIIRFLSPTMRSDWGDLFADRFVGGSDFHQGKTDTLDGVVATRRTLVFRLTKPWPQL